MARQLHSIKLMRAAEVVLYESSLGACFIDGAFNAFHVEAVTAEFSVRAVYGQVEAAGVTALEFEVEIGLFSRDLPDVAPR